MKIQCHLNSRLWLITALKNWMSSEFQWIMERTVAERSCGEYGLKVWVEYWLSMGWEYGLSMGWNLSSETVSIALQYYCNCAVKTCALWNFGRRGISKAFVLHYYCITLCGKLLPWKVKCHPNSKLPSINALKNQMPRELKIMINYRISGNNNKHQYKQERYKDAHTHSGPSEEMESHFETDQSKRGGT